MQRTPHRGSTRCTTLIFSMSNPPPHADSLHTSSTTHLQAHHTSERSTAWHHTSSTAKRSHASRHSHATSIPASHAAQPMEITPAPTERFSEHHHETGSARTTGGMSPITARKGPTASYALHPMHPCTRVRQPGNSNSGTISCSTEPRSTPSANSINAPWTQQTGPSGSP